MKKKLTLILSLIIILALGYLIFLKKDDKKPDSMTKYIPSSSVGANLNSDEFSKYTIDNQNSIYFIVNKKRSLPSTFVPQNLVTTRGEQMRADTGEALNKLIDGAKRDGVYLKIISGYRSYNYQTGVYSGYVKKDGVAKADTYSARPGHSEHQTGLAVDLGSGVCDLQACFGDTKAGKWLAVHAHEYGFIVRYQKDKENLTGYQYEPWHIRYAGDDLADKIYESGKTMEQFFSLSPALSY